MSSSFKLDSLADFLRIAKTETIENPTVRRNMLLGSMTWIPLYVFFQKLYYPFMYKKFADGAHSIPKISSTMSGASQMKLLSTLHAIYVVWSTSKVWRENDYKTDDIFNAAHFDVPSDLLYSLNVTTAYFLIDLVPLLYYTPNNIEQVIHHLLSVGFCSLLKHLNIGGPGYIFVGFYGELSTMLLHPAWFVKHLSQKFPSNGMLEKAAHGMGLLFAVVFLFCRLGRYLYYAPTVCRNIYAFDDEERLPKIGKYYFIAMIVMMNMISLVWSYKLLRLIKRVVSGKAVKIKLGS